MFTAHLLTAKMAGCDWPRFAPGDSVLICLGFCLRRDPKSAPQVSCGCQQALKAAVLGPDGQEFQTTDD